MLNTPAALKRASNPTHSPIVHRVGGWVGSWGAVTVTEPSRLDATHTHAPPPSRLYLGFARTGAWRTAWTADSSGSSVRCRLRLGCRARWGWGSSGQKDLLCRFLRPG